MENAIKYSDVHKKISISMKTYEMYSEIGIKDFGIGIPESDQPQIFARFYRGKNVKNFEGSGIGLYLSKLIIEKKMDILLWILILKEVRVSMCSYKIVRIK